MRNRGLILSAACAYACLAVEVNAGLEDYESYPKRSDADAAVIEWGHSAMIQSVDGVVASFGAQISETEAALFEVEASVVMSQPPQACGKGGLKNAAKLHGQIALVMRGGCNFLTKANLAVKAGAAALVVINNDAASPDHAFAMDGNDAPQSDVVVDIPCVMVSYNGGQALLTDDPPRVRLYAGAGRPFIETVSDASPVLYLVHNLLTPEECDRLVALAKPRLRPSRPVSKGADPAQPLATRKSNSTLLVLGAWKDSVLEALDQKVSSVIGYPTSYFADLEVNHYSVGGLYAPHYDWSPSMYQEHVMTLLLCLDDVPVGAGGEAVFPYASPPVKVGARRARSRKKVTPDRPHIVRLECSTGATSQRPRNCASQRGRRRRALPARHQWRLALVEWGELDRSPVDFRHPDAVCAPSGAPDDALAFWRRPARNGAARHRSRRARIRRGHRIPRRELVPRRLLRSRGARSRLACSVRGVENAAHRPTAAHGV